MQIFLKVNNFLFILYFEMCKNIIFIFTHGSNIAFHGLKYEYKDSVVALKTLKTHGTPILLKSFMIT